MSLLQTMDALRSLFQLQRQVSQTMDTPLEPLAGSWPFFIECNGLHYVWRGWGPGEEATTIGVYDVQTESWTLRPTTGPPPPGVFGGGCVVIGTKLYCFGGFHNSSRFNDLHKLNLETSKWINISSRQDQSEQPICKTECGFVSVDETTLVCFGGYGKGPTQPGSTFTGSMEKNGLTNELHFFHLKKGLWSSPQVKGERPPPCSSFSFTKVDQERVVLFGGNQSILSCVSVVYILNLRNMEVTRVKPGHPWPVGRAWHGACCLNYNNDHPTLLVLGGVDNDNTVLNDMWLLDVTSGRWTEVTPPESLKPRWCHSITSTCLRPGLSEVLVFGGKFTFTGDHIAETTILRFERSQSVTGPPTEKWALVNVATNKTRGSSQRLREKREKIRQATHRPSSENALREALHSSQDRVRALEQQSRVAEQRAQDAEQRERATHRRCEDAERRVQEVVTENGRLQDELEGKTKELAAHNTEVWRIPSSKVSTMRTIGSGGWGEVLEGTVRVAVKRLHPAILNQRNLERLQREMRLLAEVRHPNLVQFIGAVLDRSPPLIITELLDINLRQAYKQNRLGPGDRLSIFVDIARALDYLHQRYEPIIHRDVSAPNVLLQRMPNNQWKGKVSDLGSANFLQNAQTMGEGAIVYSPPEVIPQAYDDTEPPPQTVKIDVYSYGIVVCEVTASRFPSQENYREMFRQVQRDHPQVYKLIMHCKSRQPSDRPSMAEVIVELSKLSPF